MRFVKKHGNKTLPTKRSDYFELAVYYLFVCVLQVYLLSALYSVPGSRTVTCDILYALVSNSAIVKDLLAKGN